MPKLKCTAGVQRFGQCLPAQRPASKPLPVARRADVTRPPGFPAGIALDAREPALLVRVNRIAEVERVFGRDHEADMKKQHRGRRHDERNERRPPLVAPGVSRREIVLSSRDASRTIERRVGTMQSLGSELEVDERRAAVRGEQHRGAQAHRVARRRAPGPAAAGEAAATARSAPAGGRPARTPTVYHRLRLLQRQRRARVDANSRSNIASAFAKSGWKSTQHRLTQRNVNRTAQPGAEPRLQQRASSRGRASQKSWNCRWTTSMQAVRDAPEDVAPARPVPQPAQRHRDHQVAVGQPARRRGCRPAG